MLLFLGAGASKAFNIADMKKLTQLAECAIKKEGYSDLLNMIYAGRLSKVFTIDVEVILSILDYLSEPSVDKIGPAGEYLKSNLQEIMSKSTYPDRRKYLKIRHRIEQIIVKSCMNCDFDSANQYYSKLFQFDARNLTKYANSQGRYSGPLQICSHAATTNYDLILERYDHDNIEPRIHFLKRGFHRNGYEWNQPVFESSREAVYLKLHGSIDWWLREPDNAIVYNDNSTTLLGEKYKQRMMIYPIYGKPDTLEPYVSMKTLGNSYIETRSTLVLDTPLEIRQ